MVKVGHARKSAPKTQRVPPPSQHSPASIAFDEAPASPIPTRLAPQLATLATEPPRTGDWRYEAKFDGYCVLACVETALSACSRETATIGPTRPASLAEAALHLRKKSSSPHQSRFKIQSVGQRLNTGFTNLDLVRYYVYVVDWILPILRDRPTSLVR